jgi:hypothetical protein
MPELNDVPVNLEPSPTRAPPPTPSAISPPSDVTDPGALDDDFANTIAKFDNLSFE